MRETPEQLERRQQRSYLAAFIGAALVYEIAIHIIGPAMAAAL